MKETFVEFAAMRGLAMRLRGLFKGADPELLDAWLGDATSSGIHVLRQFAATLRRVLFAVRNATSEPWSNGQTDGQIRIWAKLKSFRSNF